jgi:ribulose-phosphate 3-epimerase
MNSLTVKIAASMACADFWRLERQVRLLEKAKIDILHIDIMDGIFVPNFSLFPDFIATLHKFTALPLEAHLQIVEPHRFVDLFADAGATSICFHAEAAHCMHRLIDQIKGRGLQAGVAINPSTPLTAIEYILPRVDLVTVMAVDPGFYGQKFIPEVLVKVKSLRAIIDRNGYQVAIAIDGNINVANARNSVAAGAAILVAGTSSIFTGTDRIDSAVAKFRQQISI